MIIGIFGFTTKLLNKNKIRTNLRQYYKSSLRIMFSTFNFQNPEDQIERCIITMEEGIGHWSAAVCREMSIPYTVVITPYQKQSQKSNYYINKAANCVILNWVDLQPASENINNLKFNDSPKLKKDIIIHRNQWILDRCDRFIMTKLGNGIPNNSVKSTLVESTVKHEYINVPRGVYCVN